MATQIQRQTTPMSTSASTEESEPAVKKSRKRKQVEKKPVPRSSTLHGLWGKPKSADEKAQTETNVTAGTETENEMLDIIKVEQPLHFKFDPAKLAAAIESASQTERMITPPRSLPDIITETPVQNTSDVPKTPESKGSQKKHSLPQSPSEGVRRSPRNHRPNTETLPAKNPIKDAKKSHPFFLGKEARRALQVAAQPIPLALAESEGGEPSRKRQKSSSSDQQEATATTDTSLLPPKPIVPMAAKSLHPFFMSRTASMESLGSTHSMPLLPLPQGKTVYLGNAKHAPFPPYGMDHVHDLPPTVPHISHQQSLKQKKGKARESQYNGDPTAYASLINLKTTVDFVPPEKRILPKSAIIKKAESLITPDSHPALRRAFQILCAEDRRKDPDGQAWTYKFRPRRADEVFDKYDAGIELRDWMAGNRKHVPGATTTLKEMDDFIVDEEESIASDTDYDTISEVDDDTPRKPKRRKKEKFISYSNVVILTGPHGSGKSAAVHAVAEELGYQVFEISPGSQRSGKDVMDAVGEVGQSELVTKHKHLNIASSISPFDEEFLASNEEIKAKGLKGLICLDEVDILYEEDKGFWTCVTGLVEKSRTPVIMTCNGSQLFSVLMIDTSVIPQNFANCKVIEFESAEPWFLIDYLQLITLSQGHILDPSHLGNLCVESNGDLRRILTRIQFWCQFGVGDKRNGAEWIDWGGREEDWVMSKGTYVDSVKWRQEMASGAQQVLETAEETVPDLNIEGIFIPEEYYDELTYYPTSMLKWQRPKLTALTSIADFLETMSLLDYTTDRQFTAYEVTPFLQPTPDDVLGKPILRNHPGQRFESPQGGENWLSPGIRILARRVLEQTTRLGGYIISSMPNETFFSRPIYDYVHPQPYISAESFYETFSDVMFVSTLDDKYLPTVGMLHSFPTIVKDVAPYIRHIMRTEHNRRATKPEQMSLEGLWNNVRKTRSQVKEEQGGRKRWFADKLDPEAVLKTWMDISCTQSDGSTGENDMEN